MSAHGALPRKDAEHFLTIFADTLRDSLQREARIALSGIGVFTVRERAARTGRNPANQPMAGKSGFPPGRRSGSKRPRKSPTPLRRKTSGSAAVLFHWIADSRSGCVAMPAAALLMAAFLVALAIYALPALMAWSMGSPQRLAITLVDLLLGWTIIGWIVVLIWAIMSGNDGSFDEDPPPRREPWMR